MNSTPPHSPRSGAQAQMLGLRVEAHQHAGELAGAQGRDRVGAIRYSGEKLFRGRTQRLVFRQAVRGALYEAPPHGSRRRTFLCLVPGFRQCVGARPDRNPAHDREREMRARLKWPCPPGARATEPRLDATACSAWCERAAHESTSFPCRIRCSTGAATPFTEPTRPNAWPTREPRLRSPHPGNARTLFRIVQKYGGARIIVAP